MAKVSKEQAAQHRDRILDAASRLFRERGPDVSVAEVTKAAGLTHGAFYNHFSSKEALLAEAIAAAFASASEDLAARAGGALETYAEGYLSREHVHDRAGGCPMAALAGDVSRQPREVRQGFSEGVRAFVDSATGAAEDRQSALRTVSTMVGALLLARAVDSVDGGLAAEILAAAKPRVRRVA